ncbi:MAG: hypothetical protein OXH79_08295 [Boseongicola sp.]|nr:hypothetical protein [Boseongicola sp.]
MKVLILSVLLSFCCSSAHAKVIQIYFLCDTKEGAMQMVKNIFIGHRMLAPGCKNIEDLQYSVVELMGDLEAVMWQNKVAYVGYVQNDFLRGWSAGPMDLVVN